MAAPKPSLSKKIIQTVLGNKPPVPADGDLEYLGYEITAGFQRFNQKDEVFRRSWWDETVKSDAVTTFYRTHREPLRNWRRADGFAQRDYAFRNAAWHISDLFTERHRQQGRREGFTDAFTQNSAPASRKAEFESPEAAAREIKTVARALGADGAGVTVRDQRWMYSEKYQELIRRSAPNDIPEDLKWVIVIYRGMDYGLVRTAPSALGSAASGLGYSRDAAIVISLAQYIRNLGYRAVASQNDSAMSIPYAIHAGLGEYGRLGLLITKDFGPRVRLAKVFTDLPLAPDEPVNFGVKKFCRICKRCAEACPAGALPLGEPAGDSESRSTLKGVKKWSVNAPKCFAYWAAQNTDCCTCIRVCPYNKDYTKWLHRLGRWLAGTRLRRLVLKLDDALGYGQRLRPSSWWKHAENRDRNPREIF